MDTFLVNLIAATLRVATPLLLAAIGETYIERAGVLNLGIEGMMFFGAFIGFFVADMTGSLWLGFWIAVLSGILAGLLMALFSVASILYIIRSQKLEALFSETWRHVLAGLILLAFSGWIDLTEVVFRVPLALHYFKQASITSSLLITAWYLSEALLDASRVLMPVYKVPSLRPSWIVISWAALTFLFTLASKPWTWEALTPPKGIEMIFDATYALITGLTALRLVTQVRSAKEPARWLLEGGASILALGTLVSAFVLIDDVFRIPRALKILGVNVTGALALGLTLVVLSYYQWGTTSLRTPTPVEPRETLEGAEITEKVWQQLGDLSGRVILIERSTITPYADLLEGLTRLLSKSGYAPVLITRSGSYVCLLYTSPSPRD